MKYQFNEQELLSLFYDKDDIRPSMSAPYLKNGYVCATESHILIRIKAETLNGEYKEVDGLNLTLPRYNCNFTISLQDIKTALANIPQVEEVKRFGGNVICQECNGEGEVEWEYRDKRGHYYYDYFECPACNGSGYLDAPTSIKTGKKIPDLDSPIRVRNEPIRAAFIEILGKAMEIIGVDKVWCVHQASRKPVIFRVDDNIEIAIMPVVAESVYLIHGRDVK